MEMLNRVSEIHNLSSIRSDRDALADEMGSVEFRLFCLLYGGTNTNTLTSLRYAGDMAMVAKSNRVVPQLLPPTKRLAHYHRLHVYLQVIRWTVLGNDMLQAMEWGKKIGNYSLCVVMTDQDAEPEKVLQFIRCMCTSTVTLSLLLLYYVMLTYIL